MILTVGVVVLGLGVRRAKVLPAWVVWSLVIGWAAFLPVANSPTVFGFAFYVPSLLGAGMLGIGWVAVGYALWPGKTASARQPARAVSPRDSGPPFMPLNFRKQPFYVRR